jgi:hypothetical protein
VPGLAASGNVLAGHHVARKTEGMTITVFRRVLAVGGVLVLCGRVLATWPSMGGARAVGDAMFVIGAAVLAFLLGRGYERTVHRDGRVADAAT